MLACSSPVGNIDYSGLSSSPIFVGGSALNVNTNGAFVSACREHSQQLSVMFDHPVTPYDLFPLVS